jgi:hypothetical protein
VPCLYHVASMFCSSSALLMFFFHPARVLLPPSKRLHPCVLCLFRPPLNPISDRNTNSLSHTCVHARTHVCVHMCAHTRIPIHRHSHTHAHAHTITHTHTHTRTHTHTNMHTHTHAHTHTQACMGIYGLSVGINGAREATELAEEMRLVRSSPALATFPLLQTVLAWQLSWLFASNLVAEVRSLGLRVAG